MIRINLLPVEIDAGPTQVNPALFIGVAAIVPLLVIIPFHLTHARQRKNLQSEEIALKNDLDRYQPIILQVEALEAKKVQLTNRKNVIQQLEGERLRYPQFMDDFVKLLPANLWLNNLSTIIQPSGNALNVSMDIIALDNYAVADLISNLETSQIFGDVDMGALSATSIAGGGGQISFHVNTTYKKASPVPDATKKS